MSWVSSLLCSRGLSIIGNPQGIRAHNSAGVARKQLSFVFGDPAIAIGTMNDDVRCPINRIELCRVAVSRQSRQGHLIAGKATKLGAFTDPKSLIVSLCLVLSWD